MLSQTAPAALDTQTEASASPSTRLRGTQLAIARTIWVAITLLSVLLFAVAISVRIRQLQEGITGVGLPNWNAAGEVVLNPIAGGPADRAGIRPGDVLVAVDGRHVRAGLPLGLTGASGTQVRVAVRTRDGPVREYTITRVHQFAGALSQLGRSIPFYAGYHIALDILTMFGFLLAALLIVWRRSDDWLALLVALMLVVLGVRLPMDTSWISNLLGVGLYLPGSLLYELGAFLALLFFLLFPDGKFVPRWTRALALWSALNFFIASIDAFARQIQGSTVLYSFYGNLGFVYFPSWGFASLAYYRMPERWRAPRWLGALAIYALTWGAAHLFFPPGFRPDDAPVALNILFTAVTYFILAYAQIARYRRVSSPIERQQTKWVVFGATVGLVGYFGYQTLSNSLMSLSQDTLLALYFEFFGYLALCLALLVFALSFGVAILRHR